MRFIGAERALFLSLPPPQAVASAPEILLLPHNTPYLSESLYLSHTLAAGFL